MTKENHANGDAQQGQNGHNNGRPFGNLYGVVIAATWAFIALLLASLFWPNLTERTKFFTSNFWNLVIAFTVIAQVKINRQQWQSMVDGLDRTDKMIDNMKEQLTAMKTEASAAVMSAETSKRALHIAERPYLDVTNPTVSPIPFEVGSPVTYKAKIRNTGRTPAYEAWGGIYLIISETQISDETELTYPSFSHPPSKAPIGAGRSYTRNRTTPNLRLTQFDVERLNDGRLFLYVYGVEFYKDVFTTDTHRLAYCQQYNRLTQRMEVAPFHNSSD